LKKEGVRVRDSPQEEKKGKLVERCAGMGLSSKKKGRTRGRKRFGKNARGEPKIIRHTFGYWANLKRPTPKRKNKKKRAAKKRPQKEPAPYRKQKHNANLHGGKTPLKVRPQSFTWP